MEELIVILLIAMIFAGILVLWIAVTNKRALREMEHRERLAMIQRGLMPAPETDPLGFEAATTTATETSSPSQRWRSAGIIIIGLGLALMMLLTFTVGEPGVGIGVGGAFAILGAAVLLNGTHLSRNDAYRPRARIAVRPPSPSEPPNFPPQGPLG